MEIRYEYNLIPGADDIAGLYVSAGLERPVHDTDRITGMYENSDLVISAWEGELLVGVSRSITDFHYSCYLADLAVRKEWQRSGIGKELVRLTKKRIGEGCMLLLLSAPAAMAYYPKIGMEKLDNAFLIGRSQ